MQQQKGQIHIILLVLFVVGVILYLNFSDKSLMKFILPSSTESTPAREIKTYAPSTPLTPITPAPVFIAPVPSAPVQQPVQPPKDETSPVVSNPSHFRNVLAPDTKEVVISVSTDEPASCKYITDQSSSRYNSMSWYDQTKRFHVKTITGLVNGNLYDFFVRCQDFNGNANTWDVLISFSVAQ